ncbi:hypothetical protein N0V85_003409 [Neurospora sp. IMI 360204]|nr:hypothetical protein N0V85_003409 [Neurospora sp. IMI 360204]
MASLSGRPTAPIRKTSAYNPAFEQLMIDHSIYPLRYRVPNNLNATTPQPNNLAEERKLLSKRRPSLDSFTETDFEDFQQKNDAANTEATVYQTVVPLITGSSDSPSWANNLFSNLEDIAEDVVKPKPDFFDGAHRMAIHEKIRSANEGGNLNLNKLIIPTNNVRTPVLPNFFMELKGPESNARIAQRQVMHVGAVGARAMNSVQNWGKEEPSYDGNAYTFSSTYHDGLLGLYAHHVAPPTAPGGRPQYYMTLVKSFCLTNDIDTWRQGVKAFRNARDRARWHRDNFIQAANARAGQSDGAAAAPPEAGTGTTAAAGVADVVVDGEPAHISTAASSRA